MPVYGILMYPSYNRVYFQSSKDLALAELQVANSRLSQPCLDIGQREIAGVDYIVFNTERPLSEDDIKIISRLSFVYAMFEISTNKTDSYRNSNGDSNKEKSGDTDKSCCSEKSSNREKSSDSGEDNDSREMHVLSGQPLYPVTLDPEAYFDDDLITILKYSGKTNEAFTKLLVNVAWLTCSTKTEGRIRLLDPISGRGTSLFQGLIYGFDVSGIELDRMAVQQATTFFTKYLQTKRYKHKSSQSKISEQGKKICDITRYEVALSKDAMKSGDTLAADFYRGDTVMTDKYIKKNSVDIIVGDLPYGVQHGSNTQAGTFTRNPEGLIKEALPQWYKVLKPGGTLALSWNTFVLKREQLAEIMESTGLKVLTEGPFENFAHRVDQAIIRDIIIGRKQ